MLWQRCLELPNFALTCSTWKVRKCLALKSTNLTCHLERSGITQARKSQLCLSMSWNKVLSSSNCWLFFDQHTGRMLFQPPGNGCNSSYTRQTANLCWHPNNTSCHWCLGKSQQLCIYYNSEGSHLTNNNDSTSWIWMHHYFRFRGCAKYWVVHDHHWLFSKLFMSLLQGDTYSPLIWRFPNLVIC
jgi:hypothetical protein